MEVVTEILEANLVSAIIALIGVIISLKWSTGETTKRMEQALKVYEKSTIIPHFRTQKVNLIERYMFLPKGQIWNLKYFRVLVKIVEKYYS